MYKFKFTLDEIEDVAKSLINKINGVNIILLKHWRLRPMDLEYPRFYGTVREAVKNTGILRSGWP